MTNAQIHPPITDDGTDDGGRSAETGSQGAIEDLGLRSRRVDEEGHKNADGEFLTVWVRTKHDDRLDFEPALLLECQGDYFKCAIKGDLWLIPYFDLAWSPPAPS